MNVVPSVDNFEVPKLDKVGVFGVPDGDDGVHLLDQLLLLLVLEVHVPLGEPRLPSPVLDHYEFDSHVADNQHKISESVDICTFIHIIRTRRVYHVPLLFTKN